MIKHGKTSDCARNVGFPRGPQPYEYAHVAKQPRSDYKIRHRDAERTRMEMIKKSNEEYFKSLMFQVRHQKMIDSADKKHVHNKIKNAVECAMKANAHLYEEERPKLELEPEPSVKMTNDQQSVENTKKSTILVDYSIITDEEKRKFVEEKRLQMIRENSQELRAASVAERKKDISNLNYKIIQDKNRIDQEQKIKKIELANSKNAEILQMQALAKLEEQKKDREKKLRTRKDLFEQVQQIEEIKNYEKELKKIDMNECNKFIEQLKEEEKLEKLNRIKSQEQRKEDIKRFTVERSKLYSTMDKAEALFMETLRKTMAKNVEDDMAAKAEKKNQLKVKNEDFLKERDAIREEKRKQAEEKHNALMRILNERNELELSIEREKAEKRLKISEDAKRALMEQIRSREAYREEQKEARRKENERLNRKHEEYLERVKRQREEKLLQQAQFRKEINEQIKMKKDSITKI